jgi:hypothetical protein
LLRDASKDRLEEITGGRRIAEVEGHVGQHHRRERVALGLTEELLRFGKSPLPAAQVR